MAIGKHRDSFSLLVSEAFSGLLETQGLSWSGGGYLLGGACGRYCLASDVLLSLGATAHLIIRAAGAAMLGLDVLGVRSVFAFLGMWVPSRFTIAGDRGATFQEPDS